MTTADPTLTGQIQNDQSNAYLQVEFDHDGDGSADGSVQADAAGKFVYLPLGLTAGTVTVSARSREWDYVSRSYRFGNWESITFDYAPVVNATPEVATFTLLSDSGASETDGLTANVDLTGTVTDDGNLNQLQVEFDIDGDTVVDGTALTDEEGRFLFTPTLLDYGAVTVTARVRQWDAAQDQWLIGAWSSLSFTYESQTNDAPRVVAIGLVNDNGTLDDDGVTTDSLLTGAVTNEAAVEGLVVEFDHNGDGTPEGSAVVDRFAQFQYQPEDLAYGSVTIQARAVESDVSGTLVGGWTSFTFTYEAPPFPDVELVGLNLQNDTGIALDRVTTDSTLTGKVGGTGTVDSVTVQFDHDGDGSADGTADTDTSGLGSFIYAPAGLPLGENTISARVLGTSEWTTLTFDLRLPASTLNLALTNDTGSVTTDGVTDDPTVSGSLATNPLGTVTDAGVTILFDHDGDGVTDGEVETVAGGTFSYTPLGLKDGQTRIRARTQQTDADGKTQYGEWVNVTFVLADDPDAPEATGSAGIAATYDQAIHAAGAAQHTADAATATDYNDSVAAAGGTYLVSVSNADATYASSSQTASAAFDTANGTATADFQAAVAAAAADYATEMGQYSGDSTSFSIDGIVAAITADPESFSFNTWFWPDAPSMEGGPDPASTVVAVAAPTYVGPEYHFELDAAYLTTVNSAHATLNSALASAKSTYDAAVAQAKSTYQSAVDAAKSAKTTAEAAANSQYTTEISNNGGNPHNVTTAQSTYDNEIQAADAEYKVAFDAAEARFQLVVHEYGYYGMTQSPAYQQIAVDHATAVAIAEATRDAVIAAASASMAQAQTDYDNGNITQAEYDAAMEAGFQQQETAYKNFEFAMIDADLARDQAYLDLNYDAQEAIRIAKEQRDLDQSLALKLRDQRKNDAVIPLETVKRDHQLWKENRKPIARGNRDIARAAAQRDYELAVAAAKHARKVAVEAAKRDKAIAGVQAQSDYNLAVATARSAALSAWASADGGLWTTYQAALAQNQLDFATTMEPARIAHATTHADAAYTKTVGISNAHLLKEQTVANATHTRAVAQANKVRQYITDTNGETKATNLNVVIGIKDYKNNKAETNDAARLDLIEATSIREAADNYSRYLYDDEALEANAQLQRDNLNYLSDAQQIYDDRMAVALYQLDSDLYFSEARFIDATKDLEIERERSFFSDFEVMINAVLAGIKAKYDAISNYGKELDVQMTEVYRDFNKTSAQASTQMQKSTADVTAAWIIALSNNDATMNTASADAQKTLAEENAAERQTFKVGEATAYHTSMQSWDAAVDTAWSNFYVDMASAELTRVTTLAAADVAYVSAIAAADHAWIAAANTSQSTYDQLQANQFVTSIHASADASLTAAETAADAAVTRAQNIADARHIYVQTITSLTKTFESEKESAKKAKDSGYSSAKWKFWASSAKASLKGAVSLGIWGRNDVAKAKKTRARREAITERSYVVSVAHARREYTGNAPYVDESGDPVAGKGEVYAQQVLIAALGTARETFVTTVETAKLTAATTSITVEDNRKIAVADAEIARATAVANADQARAVAVALADHTHSVGAAQAERDHAISVVNAETTFDIVSTGEYATEVSNWAVVVDTPHAYFLAEVAAANHVRVADQASSIVSYVTSQADADLALATALAGAEQTYAGVSATAQQTRDIALVTSQQTAAKTISAASKTAGIADVTARKTKEIANATAEKDYNNAMALSTAAFESAIADANITWVSSVATAKGTKHIAGDESGADAVYQAARAAADATKLSAVGVANVARTSSRGAALVGWMQAVTQADVTYVTTAGVAGVTMSTATVAAADVAADSEKTARIAYATSLAGGWETRGNSVQTALETWTNSYGTAEIALAAGIGPSDIAYQSAVADAEGNYHIGVATENHIILEELIDGNTQQFWQFELAKSQAWLDWVTAVAPAYSTYVTAVVTADDTHSQAALSAKVARDDAHIAADTAYVQTVGVAVKTHTIAQATAIETFISANTKLQNAKNHAYAVAKNGATVSRAIATKDYAVAMTQAQVDKDTGYKQAWADNPNDYNGQQSDQQFFDLLHQTDVADAEHNRRVAHADLAKSENLAVNAADFAWQTGLATDYAAFQNAQANADHALDIAHIPAIQTRTLAYNVAQSDYEYAVSDADETFTIDTAQADADLLDVQFTERADVLDDVATAVSIPWTNYVAALAGAEAAWVTARGPVYVTYVTNIAGIEHDYTDADTAAWLAEADGMAVAIATYDTAAAGARITESLATSAAATAYVTTVAPLQQDYLNALAAADRDRTVALSEAARTWEYSDKTTADIAVKAAAEAAAQTAWSDAVGPESSWFALFETLAQADRMTALDAASAAGVQTRSTAMETYGLTLAQLAHTYHVTMADAAYNRNAAVAVAAADDWISMADSYAAEMTTMSVSVNTPWAARRARLANAYAAWVQAVAPARRDHTIAVADAAKVRAIAVADAERAKAEAEATEFREMEIAFAQSQTDYVADQVAALDDYTGDYSEYVDQHGVLYVGRMLPTGTRESTSVLYVLSDGRLGEKPDLYYEEFKFLDENYVMSGTHGDGTYMKLIDLMFVSDAELRRRETEAMGYSSEITRWGGEKVRSIIGDENLIHAKDWQLLAGTAVVATVITVGAVAGGGPAIIGALQAAGIGAVVDVGIQLYNTGSVDFGQVLGNAVFNVGSALAFGGALRIFGTAISKVAGPFLGKAAACNVATFVVSWTGRAVGAYYTAQSLQAIADGDWETAVHMVAGAVGSRMASRGIGKFCFVAETPVAIGWVGETFDATVVLPSTDDNPAAMAWLAGGAGALLVAFGLTREKKKRRKVPVRSVFDEWFSTGAIDEMWLSHSGGHEPDRPPPVVAKAALPGDNRSQEIEMTTEASASTYAESEISVPRRTSRLLSTSLFAFALLASCLCFFKAGLFSGLTSPAEASVEPCPPIQNNAGRVVTGKFTHESARVLDIVVSGESKPIGTTDAHPFWSEDRQAFVPAGKLRVGETLLTAADKTARVLSTTPRRKAETIFNIEVNVEHVYYVDASGLLVHNAYHSKTYNNKVEAYRQYAKRQQNAGHTYLKTHKWGRKYDALAWLPVEQFTTGRNRTATPATETEDPRRRGQRRPIRMEPQESLNGPIIRHCQTLILCHDHRRDVDRCRQERPQMSEYRSLCRAPFSNGLTTSAVDSCSGA